MIALVLAALVASPAAAQSDADRLLRTVWSECGHACSDDEIAALHLVIASTAEREDVSYATAWRLLSPRLAAGTVSRAWLAGLSESCREPEGWAAYYERDGEVMRRVPWSRYRARCLALVERVRAVITGAVVSRCAATPRSWGNAADRMRGEARGRARFVEIDCGDCRNSFGRWVPL